MVVIGGARTTAEQRPSFYGSGQGRSRLSERGSGFGYVDGRDIDLVIRMAENQAERLPGLANEIVAGKPAAIVAGADAALVAAATPGAEDRAGAIGFLGNKSPDVFSAAWADDVTE